MYFLEKGFVIIVGSILLSLGINLFLTPYEILDGGIIGLALIFNYLFHLKIVLTMICLSIPIFLLAWLNYRHYFYNSLHGMLISSFFVDLLKPLRYTILIDSIYSAIIGGFLIGLGIGLMLKYETSTGGTDLFAQFISDKIGINVGIIISIIDAIIIFVGGLLLSTSTLLLSMITILVVGLTTTLVTSY